MRARSTLLALGLSASVLAACNAGPDYKLPKEAEINAPAAQGNFMASPAGTSVQAPVPGHWWKLYDDPVLNGLEEDALKANIDLRIAAANVSRAAAVEDEVAGAQNPALEVSSGTSREVLSGESYLLDTRLPLQNLGDDGGMLSYQIDIAGRLRRAAEAAHDDAEATAAAADLAHVTVAASVAGAYIEACAAGHESDIAHQTVDLQQRTLEITQAMVTAGRSPSTELTRATGLLKQAQASLPVYEARRHAALYRLAILTGHPPSEYPKAVETCEAPPRLSQPIPVGDGAALLKRRPDVRQAERNLAAATARIGVATAALYPTVTIGLQGGFTGALSDIGEAATQHYGAFSLISWTLPTGGERARIREADAATVASLARFDGVVLNALRETETTLSTYASDLDRNTDLRAARDAAQQSADEVKAMLEAGRSPYAAGIDAQKTVVAADAALAASDDQLAADQVSLFLALGGGWEKS